VRSRCAVSNVLKQTHHLSTTPRVCCLPACLLRGAGESHAVQELRESLALAKVTTSRAYRGCMHHSET